MFFKQIRGQYVPLSRAVLITSTSLGISRIAARRRIERLRAKGKFIKEYKVCGKISYSVCDFNNFLADDNENE